MYHIQEASKISGVSTRTLHYYDEIGLLSPKKSENGYRLYSEEDMDTLQLILFYKFFHFPLKDIKRLLNEEETTKIITLKKQLSLLKNEAIQLEQLIDTLEKTIQNMKGNVTMTTNEKFRGFPSETHHQYREEAIETYGEEVIVAAEKRQEGKEDELLQQMNEIFFAFAENHKNKVPYDAPTVIALAKKLHATLRQYAFDCTLEIFGCIGKGYVADPRFKENIDQFGEGTAQYASDAIAFYVAQGQ